MPYTPELDREIINAAKDVRRKYKHISDNQLCERIVKQYNIQRTKESLSKHFRYKLRHIVLKEEDREKKERKRARIQRQIQRGEHPSQYNEESSGSEDDAEVFLIHQSEDETDDCDYYEDEQGYCYYKVPA